MSRLEIPTPRDILNKKGILEDKTLELLIKTLNEWEPGERVSCSLYGIDDNRDTIRDVLAAKGWNVTIRRVPMPGEPGDRITMWRKGDNSNG